MILKIYLNKKINKVKLHQPPDMNDDHDDRLGCFVTGTALNNDIYRFVQFHFHWRNSHSSGSEHAINGNKFTMEVCLLCLFVSIFFPNSKQIHVYQS